ncbi:MAG: ABC transporter substrate-binding protein [Crocosphaera sp.]|nr:ABC transporter substrate-binding protein [Crocosphaera sp.]
MDRIIKQQIIERLKADIDKFIDDILQEPGNGKIQEHDENIIALFLLGCINNEIAEQQNITAQGIRDRLNKYIYPRIAQLMRVEQAEIAGNWTRILNFLLDPSNNYRLNPPLQLNDDNFQSSLGNQLFIFSQEKDIVQNQIEGIEAYKMGLFYKAYRLFLSAWKKEKERYSVGNPETLIYLNNCLIEQYKNTLEEEEVKIYTLAIVVPFHHNQGKVASEILRGIAQIQSLINYSIYQHLSNLEYIEELQQQFFSINQNTQKIVIKILIVNEPNNIHFSTNKIAEKLCELCSELNIIAVLGHYSSEMTKKAIPIYSKHGMVLLNFSSTSNELSDLSEGEKWVFYRLNTKDMIAGQKLVNYLTEISTDNKYQNTSIIYNQNSSYSSSYQKTIKTCLKQNKSLFNHLGDYSNLGGNRHKIRSYLTQIIDKNVDIIFIIPDGGIEPNSLNNTGFISRLNVSNCLIAGSATFYQENVIYWVDELKQLELITHENMNIIACIPWHFNSSNNGINSNNNMSTNFCSLGRKLWGDNNLTWRSATAFDAVLTVFRTLEKYSINNHQDLSEKMDIFLKRNQKIINGVTGKIEFIENGDRLNPPTEIAKIKFNKNREKWQWDTV